MVLSLGMVAASGHPVWAGLESETVTVLGTYLPDGLAADSAVTTLERESAGPAVSPDLARWLSRASGIAVTRMGGPGGVSEIFLRGAESNFTPVYIDGVLSNDPTNTRGGSFDISTINTDEIARIHVARGPFSSVYGSNALTGVILIETQNAEPGTGPTDG